MIRMHAIMTAHWRTGLVGIVFSAGVLALWPWGHGSPIHEASAQSLAPGGPIHGYVAAFLSPDRQSDRPVGRGALVNVPDIGVVARNTQTGAESPAVKTNPQGYFRTPRVPAGVYQICVKGAGYVSSCDPQSVTVAGSIRVLNHVVPIEPTPRAISGTVWLADKVTPCFWFRPAFSTTFVLTAKVSLVDAGGNVIAGPVNGNSLGQYVLPTSAGPGKFTLRAICEESGRNEEVTLLSGSTQQDIVIRNSPPQIVSLDFTKGPVGVRRANPGDVIRATVTTADRDGDDLHYQWTDDSGRVLGLPDAPSVEWRLIERPSINTLHVQVSDKKGGFAVGRRDLRAGPNEILFAGTVFNRQDRTPIDKAQVTLNEGRAETDAAGRFQVTVPDAPRFVLNINKTGFALSSRVYYGRNTGLQIPLDSVIKGTVNGRNGGRVALAPDTCRTKCTLDECRKLCQAGARGAQGKECDNLCRSRVELQLGFDPGALVDASGKPYAGTATVEALQYDTSLSNPIPGDQGAISQGKTVRLTTFGAFYIQPRDANGNPLQMAANKKVTVSMPIEPRLLAKAPSKIPFFRYDEGRGMWIEEGTLTRSGDRYSGEVTHFSAFNADTMSAGSACVKVILDPASFTLPVALDASYVDPSNGAFYHNGTQATTNPVGIERMVPNVNFTLEIRDASNATVLQTVTLNSGPPLSSTLFPDGLVSDPNFTPCNGPITISNVGPSGPLPTFLTPVPGGSFTDNSTNYSAATNAGAGGNRATFPQWLALNGFPDSGDATAIYFNNGDLKFGRNMHCRVTAAGTTACYVSNYGTVGINDAVTALADARNPLVAPGATVAMEYDPAASGGENVQFWAYDGTGAYLPKPWLDSQGGKPIPDICLACHGGYYSGASGARVAGAVFLPFDLDSFIYDAQGDPHGTSASALAAQEQFRRLNAIVLNTSPDTSTGDGNKPFTQLMSMSVWYPGGVNVTGSTFAFSTGAGQIGNFPGHEPLYDAVVKVVCRTCHIAQSAFDDWTKYNQMSPGLIQSYACGSGSVGTRTTVNFTMPHAEVPFKRFWQDSLSSTVDSELTLAPPGCPNQ